MSEEKDTKTVGTLLDDLLSAEIKLKFWKLLLIVVASVVMGFIIK